VREVTGYPQNATEAPRLNGTRKGGEMSHPLKFCIIWKKYGDGVNIRRNTDGDRARQTPRSPINTGFEALKNFLIFFEKK